MIASFVRNHAQVLVVVHPRPRGTVECLIVSFEMPHLSHELDNLLQLSILKLSVGIRSSQNLRDPGEGNAAFRVHQYAGDLMCQDIERSMVNDCRLERGFLCQVADSYGLRESR